ncbi:Major facilitator superfamily [Fusarium acutatum]|uniref:Major facilitator superfamily n=1 Tax=Fusarium acutatum TaxID=78861 RepID=A0A8H4NDK1_9HYPO|nr:Major facilitator superfamily [Fusarium acutatum]
MENKKSRQSQDAPEKDIDVGETQETHSDVGLEYYRQSQLMDPARREEVAKKVLRKIDFILLPSMCLIYLLSFLDKQTLNYASAYGLKKDLNLVGNNYSWIASVTNIGYLVGSYPSSICLQKLPIGKFISCMLICWGALLVSTVGAKNFAGMMVLRFLLGALEACIGPAWMLITSMFWKRDEQPLRMCIWLGCNGISLMLGAGISWGLGHTENTHLEPWQLVFLVIGVVTISGGCIAFLFFPSSPIDFKLFTHEEKVVSIWRIADNQTGIKHSTVLNYQIKEALLKPRVWFIAGQQIAIGIINAGITNFMSALLAGFGYSPNQVILWQLPNGAFQLVMTIAAGAIASNVRNSSILCAIAVQIPSLAGILGIALIPIEHRLALTACCWLLGIIGAAIILNWSIVASNISGHTKRMTVNGLNFVCYAIGNIIGPFLFQAKGAPRYHSAIWALCGVYAACIIFTSLIGLTMWMSNKRRAQAAREAGTSEPISACNDIGEDGFRDLTDRENRNFCYKL